MHLQGCHARRAAGAIDRDPDCRAVECARRPCGSPSRTPPSTCSPSRSGWTPTSTGRRRRAAAPRLVGAKGGDCCGALGRSLGCDGTRSLSFSSSSSRHGPLGTCPARCGVLCGWPRVGVAIAIVRHIDRAAVETVRLELELKAPLSSSLRTEAQTPSADADSLQ